MQGVRSYIVECGSNLHTFKHGLFHGFLASLCFALPILGYVTIFEHKSAKYFWVNQGYWTVCRMVMVAEIGQCGALPV